jgi:hypothetical protein
MKVMRQLIHLTLILSTLLLVNTRIQAKHNLDLFQCIQDQAKKTSGKLPQLFHVARCEEDSGEWISEEQNTLESHPREWILALPKNYVKEKDELSQKFLQHVATLKSRLWNDIQNQSPLHGPGIRW